MHSVNLALEAGRKLQSTQTGFVHYCTEAREGPHQTIPVLENALFALALFRSRLSENVLEGKEIITRLLAFEREGNFPVYLHAYPTQNDPYLGMRVMPVFYWLLHDFSHVLGSLKETLKSTLDRIIERAKNSDLPPWAAFRLLAYEGKIGPLPNGQVEWGEAFLSLQIAESRGASIEEAIQEGAKLWHPSLQLYTGPALRRGYEGKAPEFTLYDFFLCQWQKGFPARAEAPFCPVHLRGGLIRPLGFELPLEEKPPVHTHFDAGEESPLFIAWDVHTFMLAKKHLKVAGNAEEMVITYPDTLPDTEDKSFELNFFLGHHPDHTLLVNGKRASSFHFGDEVEIRSKALSIKLIFSADEGRYFGHFMRGNRPSQHGMRGDSQFASYDWRIAVRTVSRKALATIRVQVQVVEPALESQPPHPLHASHYPHTESPLSRQQP